MKFHENEVLCAAMWLYSRAMFDPSPYDDFILRCMNKNDQSKDLHMIKAKCLY